MEIKGEYLLFLLGAGASVDAGIPISNQMVSKIETLVIANEDWKPYKELYYYLKSSINYSDGILGKFNEPFNVERLLIVITEIEKRESNIMYPFIGTWNIRLLDLAGNNFENLKNLHKLIRKQLNEWVGLRSYDKATYFESFSSLSTDIATLMKVFTLNYDMCFENIVGKDKVIELGFTKEANEWHQSNFENNSGAHYHLFKLHGSIDWYIENDKLHKSDKIEANPELIFGIQHKMTSVDPYFYYSSVLRNSCFADAKIITVIGYSYADEYVNVILSQALNSKSELRLINVAPLFGRDLEAEKDIICANLNLRNKNQLVYVDKTAKEFLTGVMNKEFFERNLAEPEDVPFS
ncbi:SIR2 family protein [Chryseobacterium gambrini]|uniref:SIR2 family protein n=1 Tax=Chryseobacterium gambrini TaxID=373672 RepID=UPI003D0F603A